MDRARQDARVLIKGNKKLSHRPWKPRSAAKIEIRSCAVAMSFKETTAVETAFPLVLKFHPALTCE